MSKKRARTSASNVFRRRLCPGSAEAEDGLAEHDSEYSGEGQMLHKLYYTGQRPENLTEDQRSALDLADFYTDEFISNVRAKYEIPLEARYIDEREVALEFRDPKGALIFPGHADLIRTWPDFNVRAVSDAKFGFMEVDDAADNDQLASYAVSRNQIHPSKAIGVAIVQPRNFGPRISQAIYTAPSMVAAAADLERVVRASDKRGAERIAGDKQCHFCKAKTVCDEYKAKFMGIDASDVFPLFTVPTTKLEAIHIAVSYANKIKDEVADEMRRRIAAGEMPGWKLGNSGDDVYLIDALGFYNQLKKRFEDNPEFTPKAFDDCREMQWGRLVALIQKLTKMSEKKAKDFIKLFSEGFVNRKPKKMKIVRDAGGIGIPNLTITRGEK